MKINKFYNLIINPEVLQNFSVVYK